MIPTLRAPRPTDYEALATWVADATACQRWAGPRVPFPLSAETLPGLLAMQDAQSWFLDEGADKPVGFGQFWPTAPGSVHLGRVIVAPEMRGWGLGVVLCRSLATLAARSTGANAVTLRVYRDNPAALHTYEGLGFAPVEAESDAAVCFMKADAAPFAYAAR